ncbi:MAG: hypothetical protein ABIG20_03600 [archaeon]
MIKWLKGEIAKGAVDGLKEGIQSLEKKDLEGGLANFGRALKAAPDRSDDKYRALLGLTVVSFEAKEYGEAIDYCMLCLDSSAPFSRKIRVPIALMLGISSFEEGRKNKSKIQLGTAVTYLEIVGASEEIDLKIDAKKYLAKIYVLRGDEKGTSAKRECPEYEKAVTALKCAKNLAVEIENKLKIAEIQLELGKVQTKRQNYTAAYTELKEALEYATQKGHTELIKRSAFYVGQVCLLKAFKNYDPQHRLVDTAIKRFSQVEQLSVSRSNEHSTAIEGVGDCLMLKATHFEVYLGNAKFEAMLKDANKKYEAAGKGTANARPSKKGDILNGILELYKSLKNEASAVEANLGLARKCYEPLDSLPDYEPNLRLKLLSNLIIAKLVWQKAQNLAIKGLTEDYTKGLKKQKVSLAELGVLLAKKLKEKQEKLREAGSDVRTEDVATIFLREKADQLKENTPQEGNTPREKTLKDIVKDIDLYQKSANEFWNHVSALEVELGIERQTDVYLQA